MPVPIDTEGLIVAAVPENDADLIPVATVVALPLVGNVPALQPLALPTLTVECVKLGTEPTPVIE